MLHMFVQQKIKIYKIVIKKGKSYKDLPLVRVAGLEPTAS